MVPKKSVFALAKALDGIPILGTLGGTPAARAGIRYGDILISVNGRRTHNFADYLEAKALRADGMTLVVFRTGAEKLEELTYDESAPPVSPAAVLAELITKRLTPTEHELELLGGKEDDSPGQTS